MVKRKRTRKRKVFMEFSKKKVEKIDTDES